MSTLSDIATHTRASSATYVDANGILQTAAINEPRVGHHIWNGSAWVDEGYLHESEARTNLVTYSDLSSGWGETRSVLTFDQGISPDGTNNATKLTSDLTAANSHSSNILVNAPAVDSSVVFSTFLKEDTLRYAQIRVVDNATNVNGGTNNYDVHFDLRDGVITSQAGYVGTAIAPVAYIENAGNGWFRCSVGLTKAGDAVRTDAALYLTQSTTVVNNPLFNGTGSESILIYGAQLEAGSTPSSYISTAGATVTRAADAMTIPAANLPWPEPVVIGPELVTNGTFDTDSDWTKYAGVTISGGVANATLAAQIVSQSGVYETNKVYKVSVDYTKTFGDKLRLENSTSSGANVMATSESLANGSGTLTFFVVPTVGTVFSLTASGSAYSGSIDNISVREINPLAVSIQMEGTMTYADNDQVYEVYPLQWDLNTSNFIRHRIRTSAGVNGLYDFLQAEGGVTDIILDTTGGYTTGINVPFNIASRHGSTFINGAIDGTALTADTTPTSLPYLENTDMQIGSTFNGTIKLFRMWADDLTDEGIAEASA